MARGDAQREFAEAAADDGVVLTGQSVDWLCQRGHIALPDEAGLARDALERIYIALGGDLDTLAARNLTMLSGDFLHEPTGTLVEVGESQHFTSVRLTTLDLYPGDAQLGYDLATYMQLCRAWQKKSDGYYRAKPARGFGVGGRQKQRAYYDALRDLATPAMGRPPLIRIEATERDGRAAYQRSRDRLLELVA
ncbi:MAG: hypothetical protein ACR2LH_04540 [Thermoleophilaceae bacterium]